MEVKELRERQRHDEWTICGLIARMDGMETRMMFLHAQVAAMVPTPAVDLLREENQGEVGDLMMLGPPSRMEGPSSLQLDRVQLDALEAVGRNWEFLNQEELMTGEGHTLTDH